MSKILPHQNILLSTFVEHKSHQQTPRYLAILERRKELGLELTGVESDSDFGQVISPLFELSDYLFTQLQRFPEWLDEWSSLISHANAHSSNTNTITLNRDELMRLSTEQSLSKTLNNVATLNNIEALDEQALMKQLRYHRNRWMCRLIFLDLLQLIELKDLTALLSKLADECVGISLGWLERYYQNLYGRAMDSNGQPLSMIVIGMGKLGGGELNLSSDIDLIFAFREHGDTAGGKKSITHQEYFTKLGQKLIQHLDAITVDGFVFRVDMRLRPYGQSGALVANMDSLENYYQDQGRDWERYAMIKARVMVGNRLDKEAFEALRKPFVYRKYLDFSVISALRDLKRMIVKEVQRKGIEHNVKLGKGGIREIEFIAQALQILHGGRDAGLQVPSLYDILPYLKTHHYLPEQQIEELWEAYCFLRRTEHALQAVNDEQTHLLPSDELQQNRLAIMLGFEQWSELESLLSFHREKVYVHFKELIEEEDAAEDSVTEKESWNTLINGQSAAVKAVNSDVSDIDEIIELIHQVAWQDADLAAKKIQTFIHSKAVAYMQPIGKERLATFLAYLTSALQEEDQPDNILERTFPILDSILRRTSYLVLLVENPTAITHLIRLNKASVWFSDMIAKMPALLDELLDANTLFSPPDKEKMEAELRQMLMRLPLDDDEVQMDALRRFRHSMILRIAACDITGVLPLMKVSDHLTWLAEVILDQVLSHAWQYLTGRHGFPLNNKRTADNEVIETPEMVLVGYGKSGGLELGYDSDLDLVFIHNADIANHTNGERSIDNLTFYTRLGQRIIHMLTTFTACGRLYEVDMRLRPSGNSGLLVTSLDGFTEYQQKEAWTWEHQALTRARVLSGDKALVHLFEQARQSILSIERDRKALKQDVIAMRTKMRAHLDTAKQADDFDLKQGEGGIIDIEFMVQYCVLAWSFKYPELAFYSDNIRQIEAAEKSGILTTQEAEIMSQVYQLYRSQTHRLTLQDKKRVIAKDIFQEHQDQVTQIWTQFSQETCV